MRAQRWWRSRAVVVATLTVALTGAAFVRTGHATEYDANGNSPWVPYHCGRFPTITDRVALYQVPKYMTTGYVGFWVTSWTLDDNKASVYGSNWYEPSPVTTTVSEVEWTWEDAYILFYCSTREILFGYLIEYRYVGSDVIEGSATVLHSETASSGYHEEYRNGHQSEGGSYTCYEVWLVWPDGYEEYTGTDICEGDET